MFQVVVSKGRDVKINIEDSKIELEIVWVDGKPEVRIVQRKEKYPHEEVRGEL